MADYGPDEDFVLPLVEERVSVAKRDVETGRVRISTRVEEHPTLIREALRHEDVVVERIPIGRRVETAPSIRQEGDTVIYPIMEEVLVVEKTLILKEELHIRYNIHVETVDREVTLRKMYAEIDRLPADER